MVSRTVDVRSLAAHATGATQDQVVRSTLRGFCLALAASLLIAGICILGLMTMRGESLRQAVSATAALKVRSLLDPASTDSWNAMWNAQRRYAANPEGSLYDVFFSGEAKFQYPPTALFLFDLLPDAVTNAPHALDRGSTLRRLLDAASRVAVVLTLLFSALAVKALLERLAGRDLHRLEAVLILIGCSALGMTFYPLIRAYQLGQVQVFLDCAVALAALALVRDRVSIAGICLGFCSLIKPQYTIVLAWAVIRKEWRLAQGMCAVIIPALAFSLARYGLNDHLDYLRVLNHLSRYGEAFWANQNINGLVQRALGNANPLHFDAHEFPPYHPIIHAMTLVASLAFMVASLFAKVAESDSVTSRLVCVALVLTAATIGSPIAWEHHYGALLPYVLLVLPLLVQWRPCGAATLLVWAASYCAMAVIFLRPELIYVSPARSLLGMHIFTGGLLLFVLLFALMTQMRRSQTVRLGEGAA